MTSYYCEECKCNFGIGIDCFCDPKNRWTPYLIGQYKIFLENGAKCGGLRWEGPIPTQEVLDEIYQSTEKKLKNCLLELLNACKVEVNEKGADGYLLARMTDAENLLK